VQRHVFYLGEINDSHGAAWQKSIEVSDEQQGQAIQCALFREVRPAAAQVRLNQQQLSRPRTCTRLSPQPRPIPLTIERCRTTLCHEVDISKREPHGKMQRANRVMLPSVEVVPVFQAHGANEAVPAKSATH